MTAPLDARHIANSQGDFAPQRQNNFILEIAGLTPGSDRDLIVLSLKSFKIPAEHNDPVKIRYGNEDRKVAGYAQLDDADLVIHDYVDRDTRAALLRWRRQVYDPATGAIGLPSAYKKTANVVLLATDGSHLRVAQYTGIWPSKYDPGQLSMDSDEVVDISITLTSDLATWLI